MTDTIPDYKILGRLSEEDKIRFMGNWMEQMTAAMWAKAKRAAGKDEQNVSHRCFCRVVCEAASTELPTRSRQLLQKALDHKRSTLVVKPILSFDRNFSINWAKNGVYELGDIKKRDSMDVFTTLIHRDHKIQAATLRMHSSH